MKKLKGHNPLAVANYFIENRNAVDKEGIRLMKLITLCYFSHGYALAITGKNLINETVEAWQFGPVFPTLVHEGEFKENHSISKKVIKYISGDAVEYWSSNFTKNEQEVMSQVNEKYSNFSPRQLHLMQTEKDTPWFEAWDGREEIGYPISNEIIKNYFSKK